LTEEDRGVVPPVRRVPPTMYCEPSVAPKVAPPAISPKLPPAGAGIVAVDPMSRSTVDAPFSSMTSTVVPTAAIDFAGRGMTGRLLSVESVRKS